MSTRSFLPRPERPLGLALSGDVRERKPLLSTGVADLGYFLVFPVHGADPRKIQEYRSRVTEKFLLPRAVPSDRVDQFKKRVRSRRRNAG
jgi:hypothetical protein